MIIRPATTEDYDAIWAIIEPTLRASETYTLPRDWDREAALTYWFASPHTVFVAEQEGAVLGHYFLTPNRMGGGAHVANCGFMTAPAATGRGVARTMCSHALETARAEGYRAMQFNSVISTNTRAVALWQSFDFDIMARLPEAFLHPALGYVDILVMYRML
ncbi:N-acetyltransferase [Asticcacaulis sp. 201]|uniref:GNAT family N-acetyltransferase n=1 Tax=Asticcacaulis sp. 201 TaxID=3028787 RepID=UPI002916EFCA|nr:N-acetyltransferase [Asticcacaulis sp. 201]MDV6333122.1 N-acetyltransferase [Asticcacaulis sp. 201]